MPDVMVVKGTLAFKENSTAIIKNPYIVVEVLSPVTSDYDLSSKLPEYKQLESLQQIIYVNPKKFLLQLLLAPKTLIFGSIKIFIT